MDYCKDCSSDDVTWHNGNAQYHLIVKVRRRTSLDCLNWQFQIDEIV